MVVERLRADQVLPTLPDADLEELTIYLARNARDVERILRGKSPAPETPAVEESVSLKKDKVAPLKATGS